jgi:hypothetical protein
VVDGGGLLAGITAWHIRRLCDNPWDGGGGYAAEQVGRMTLDQIWARLCDADLLKREVGSRTEKREVVQVRAAAKDGKIAGRDRDGNPIRGIVRGKSVARQLMEEQEKRRGT